MSAGGDIGDMPLPVDYLVPRVIAAFIVFS